jgi:predicted cupin superfamily sugar epimerase
MHDLIPHPEGGSYREYYRATRTVDTPVGARCAATAIYFRLCHGEVSRLHRLAHDELWFWHEGASATVHCIHPDGTYAQLRCGAPHTGGDYAILIPAGCWFGATPDGAYTIVSAVVAPGFDFADFELAERGELVKRYPHLVELINKMT